MSRRAFVVAGIVECLQPDHGGWELIDSQAPKPVRWTMCFLLTTSSLIYIYIYIHTHTHIYIYIYNCVFGSLISDVTCNYVSADGRRDSLWWPALPGHWLSFTRRWQSLLVMYWLLCLDVWNAASIFDHLPRMFLSTDHAFRISDWTCCHGPHLHAILRIISNGVSYLATDSPCGVWGRGWTTSFLHGNPLFGSHFKMRVGM